MVGAAPGGQPLVAAGDALPQRCYAWSGAPSRAATAESWARRGPAQGLLARLGRFALRTPHGIGVGLATCPSFSAKNPSLAMCILRSL